jgi:hypothetical protein
MSLTDVDICNSALTKVGAERISSLTEENERARILAEQYPKLRDKLLRSHPWNFSIARVLLAPALGTPAFGFQYQFTVPSDCLRILEINSESTWQKEGEYIVSDSPSIGIKYIKRITDTSKYDATFAEALASALAYDVSYSLVQSVTLKDTLAKEADMALRTARSFDAQEGTPGQVIANDWLTIRY